MAINPDFEIGMELFTKDGRRVELVAITTTGEYVVSQVIRFEEYDGGYNYGRGETTFEQELWKKAPVEVVDEEIAAAEKKLREAERLRSVRLSEALNAEREVKDRLAKLAKFKGLERVEDFIEGRITFLVHPDDGYKITGLDALDETEYDRKVGIKLICLYGSSKGDLSYRVNQYNDGSGGSWKEIIPCANLEDAERLRAERITSDMILRYGCEDNQPFWFLITVEAAENFGVTVTTEIRSKYQRLKQIQLAAQEAVARKAVADAQEKLDSFLAKVRTDA